MFEPPKTLNHNIYMMQFSVIIVFDEKIVIGIRNT